MILFLLNFAILLDLPVDDPDQPTMLQKLSRYMYTRLLAQNPFYILLGGAAGTGKTHFVKKFVRNLDQSEYKLMGTTNTAAEELGGETVYAAMKYTLSKLDAANINYEYYPHLKLIVIDEASMFKNYMFINIDESLRKMTRKDEIFGGCSVILIADLKQATMGEHHIYNCEDWNLFVRVDFTTNWRQQDYPQFAERLLRWADADIRYADDLRFLKGMELCPNGVDYGYVAGIFLNHAAERKYILCPTNASTNRFNRAVVDLIHGTEVATHLVAKTIELKQGEPEQSSLMADEDKRGGFVMTRDETIIFTRSMKSVDGNCTTAPGDIGTIRDFRIVRRNQVYNIKIEVNGCTHEFMREEHEKIVGGKLITEKSFHLRNPYALGIHKAQGKTMDFAIVDTSRGMGPALAYTAFSRVCNPANLRVTHVPKNIRTVIKASESIQTVLKKQKLLDLDSEIPLYIRQEEVAAEPAPPPPPPRSIWQVITQRHAEMNEMLEQMHGPHAPPLPAQQSPDGQDILDGQESPDGQESDDGQESADGRNTLDGSLGDISIDSQGGIFGSQGPRFNDSQIQQVLRDVASSSVSREVAAAKGPEVLEAVIKSTADAISEAIQKK